MINLSVSIDSIPKKRKFTSAHNTVYVSATFSNDLKTIAYVEKLFHAFMDQKIAVVIEDPTSYAYKKFFRSSNLYEFSNTLIAIDAGSDDIINVISNWCYYETGVALYVMEKDSEVLLSPNHHSLKEKFIIDYLQKNSNVIISQELDYTVNVSCKKEVCNFVLDIIKNEAFKV